MSFARVFNDEPDERGAKLIGIYATLVLANALAWIWALWALADRPTLLATAFLAYTFGLRHAVDADHIAAIDRVAQSERVGQERSRQQRRTIGQRPERPAPGQRIRQDQGRVDADQFCAPPVRLVVEYLCE